MGWLPKEQMEEWVQDQLVQAHRARWEAKREESLRALRATCRVGDLSDIRRAEARLAQIEEFLKDYEEEE